MSKSPLDAEILIQYKNRIFFPEALNKLYVKEQWELPHTKS